MRPKYIILRLLLVVIPVLMALAPAMAQNTVYAGQTTNLTVDEVSGSTYTWDLYIDNVSINFATVPGNCPVTDAKINGSNVGPVVSVTWITPGIYYFKLYVEDAKGCPNIRMGMITVLNSLPVAHIGNPNSPICNGEESILTIDLTGTGPWTIEISDGTTTKTYANITDSTFKLTVKPSITTTYTVTSVTDSFGTNDEPSNSVTVVVNPKPVSSDIYQYNPVSKKK